MKISSGTELIDNLLCGGYEAVTTIYGPASSGKTLLCLLCAINTSLQEKKVIYVDTEKGFSLTRVKQLTPHYKEVMKNITFLKPITFAQQTKMIELLTKIRKRDLIIIDNISTLYRIELSKGTEIYETNKELGIQLSCLNEISKTIPVLITNQVYISPDTHETKMVAENIIKYASNCVIELQFFKEKRKAIIKKHPIIKDNAVYFKITEKGIIGC